MPMGSGTDGQHDEELSSVVSLELARNQIHQRQSIRGRVV